METAFQFREDMYSYMGLALEKKPPQKLMLFLRQGARCTTHDAGTQTCARSRDLHPRVRAPTAACVLVALRCVARPRMHLGGETGMASMCCGRGMACAKEEED